MAQGIPIQGGVSGLLADVDSGNNLKTTLPLVNARSGGPTAYPDLTGGVRLFGERDAGAATGAAKLLSPMVSLGDRRMMVGLDSPLFEHFFAATAQDTANWYHAFSTMTITQSGGFLLTNANSTATATTGCLLMTKPQFTLLGSGALMAEINAVLTALPLANQVGILGFGYNTTATAAPTDGVWFQITNAGIVGVVNYNGTSTPTGVLVNAATITADAGKNKTYKIVLHESAVEFWYGGILVGTLNTPSGQGQPMLSNALPLYIGQYNSGTVSGSPQMQMKVANVTVEQHDMNLGMPFSLMMAKMGRMAHQGQPGGTMGMTALLTNNLAPGAGAAATNTTAALGSGLGGYFQVQPTLAVGTDGIISSYQVPLGGVNQPAMSLVITGVSIQGAVTTALTGGAVVYQYQLAYGHTAVSLAQAETGSFVTASTKAPRRVALGMESYAAAAAVGVIGQGLVRQFASPIVVNPGEFIQVAAKNLGVVTTAGVIGLSIGFDGFWM